LYSEHKSRLAEVALIDQEFAALESEREELEPPIEQARKDVSKLTENDIATMRITASDPQPSLRLLLEVFCMFLGLTPSYERSGHKLLMYPHFVQTLTSRVARVPLLPSLMENIQPYFESPDMDPNELEAIAPAMRCLYDWVEGVCRLALLDVELKTRTKMRDARHTALAEYVEEMDLEISSVRQVEVSLEEENKALAQSNASREHLEQEYRAVDAREKSMEAIFNGLEQFTER